MRSSHGQSRLLGPRVSVYCWNPAPVLDHLVSYSANLRQYLSAPVCDFFGRAQIFERLNRRLNHVVWIVGAETLGQNILYPRRLHNRSHAPTGDNSSAIGRRFENDVPGTEPSTDLERDGSFHNGNANQIFLGLL